MNKLNNEIKKLEALIQEVDKLEKENAELKSVLDRKNKSNEITADQVLSDWEANERYSMTRQRIIFAMEDYFKLKLEEYLSQKNNESSSDNDNI